MVEGKSFDEDGACQWSPLCIERPVDYTGEGELMFIHGTTRVEPGLSDIAQNN